MCTTTGTGEAVSRGLAGMQLRAAGQLDQAQEPAMAGMSDEGDQRERHPPGPPGRPGWPALGRGWSVTWRRPGRAVS